MSMMTIGILNLVFIAIIAISYLVLRVVSKRHRQDPDFVKKQHEKEAEYRRKMEEEQELDEIAYSIGTEDYSDDDVE